MTDPEVRTLYKQVREGLKTLPIDANTRDNLLKTAQDAYQRRLENRIADLQHEIAKGEKVQKSKNSTVDTKDIIKLKDKLAFVEQEHSEKFAEQNAKEKLDAREAGKVKNLKAKRDSLQRQIDQNKKDEKQKNPSSPYSEEIVNLEKEIKEFNTEILLGTIAIILFIIAFILLASIFELGGKK